MKDVPDDQKKDSFEGLSKAAIYVGEGPILYLQIMKTLGIMCSILTILNIPLFMLYSAPSNRRGVNFFNLNSLFTHFHLGNIGRNEYVCQVSNLEHDAALKEFDFLSPIEVNAEGTLSSKPQKMHFKCFTEEEYIHKVIEWGFMYKLDIALEDFTKGRGKCLEIDP